jgi:hypothetical protein
MNCPSYCTRFSTCHDDVEARETEKRLKACWDNLKDIRLHKTNGCYYKFINGVMNFYNIGTCPECGDVYLDKIEDYPPDYKKITEICRACEDVNN